MPCVPKIEFLANSIGPAKTVDVEAGGQLADICDHYFAPIPFSCRSASCGTCHIEIVEGETKRPSTIVLFCPQGDQSR